MGTWFAERKGAEQMRHLKVSTLVIGLLTPAVLGAAELSFDTFDANKSSQKARAAGLEFNGKAVTETNASSQKRGVRVWRDINGQEVIEGRFEDIVHDTVHLVDEDGLRRTIKLEELSGSDRELVDNILRARTRFFFFLLGAEEVPIEVQETLVLAGFDPLTRKPDTIHILRTKYEISETMPVVETLDQLKSACAAWLEGKTLRLSGQLVSTERPRNSTQLRIDFRMEEPQLRWWKVAFRDRIFLPARLLDGPTAVQVGDTVQFEGSLSLAIEACPRCKGKGTIDCVYCAGGVTRSTQLQHRQFPDGQGYIFPTARRALCQNCNGMGRVRCDHYVPPQPWNPFDSKDPTRWVIAQLRFEKNLSHALCFRLEEMSVSFVSNLTGNTLRLSRPSPDSAIEVKVRKN